MDADPGPVPVWAPAPPSKIRQTVGTVFSACMLAGLILTPLTGGGGFDRHDYCARHAHDTIPAPYCTHPGGTP